MSMRSIVNCLALLLAVGTASAASAASAEEQTLAELARGLPAELDGKPLLFVPLVAEAPAELKGDLSAPAWAAATPLKFAVNDTGGEPKFKSSAKIFCTQDAIYVGVQFDDPDPDHPKLDGAVWARDSFEFFLYPGEDPRQKLYYQIVVDQGGQMQCFNTHVYPGHGNFHQAARWTPDLQIKTQNTKTGWTAELRVPFSDLALAPEAKDGKSLWRMALYRNRPARGGEFTQAYAWSPTISDSYHTSWKFGYLLPERFASAELIQAVIARSKAHPPSEKVEPLTDAGKAEIDALVKKLGDDNYQERNNAHEKLASLIRENATVLTYAEETLRVAERQSDDAEIRSRARKLRGVVRERQNPDEDPLPPNAEPRGNNGKIRMQVLIPN